MGMIQPVVIMRTKQENKWLETDLKK